MMSPTSASDVQTRIAEIIHQHPVVLFMKGSPDFPQCGFSAAIVEILRRYRVTVHAVDVLQDPALRQGIKAHANWPTIPQLYVRGTFIGGTDIVRDMHYAGELAQALEAEPPEARS